MLEVMMKNGCDMATWEKTKIKVNGKEVDAQAPVIVSASRSTDIPAFYAKWFFNRLDRGYSAWKNPFNGELMYVSYEKTRFIVFWSKNPRPLLQYLPRLKEKNIKCYIQYTLNDYEEEGFEIHVPPLEERIDTFKQLVDILGPGSVVWRFDPLLLTEDVLIGSLLQKIMCIGDQLRGYTEKLVFSFADIMNYKKVKNNLDQVGIRYIDWTEQDMKAFALLLSNINNKRCWNYKLASCGEKINLGKYGISHNRCIDGDLITRLAYDDEELMKFMKVKIEPVSSLALFDAKEPTLPEGAVLLPNNTHYFISKHTKDSGQRALCQCMAAKDIGEYNTCPHQCVYCYANTSIQRAYKNYIRHKTNPHADTITGL